MRTSFSTNKQIDTIIEITIPIIVIIVANDLIFSQILSNIKSPKLV